MACVGGRHAALLLALLLALTLSPAITAEDDDWMECVKACKCKWVSGRKTAECSNSSLTTVPAGLSSQIQFLTLSWNAIPELPKDAFFSVHLKNLHKLFLQDCHIQKLSEAAFRGLEILIELDLSNNDISKLHPGTFKDTGKLRIVNLQRNPIQRLEDNLFTNLIFLQSIDLSNCQLKHIGHKTFHNVSKLQTLLLGNNKLMHIRPESFLPLVKLSYMVLRNNPWHCDCQLKEFHDWMMNRNLSIDTACAEPTGLSGRAFADLKSKDFECNFKITYPSPGVTLRVDSGNTTLSCKVVGYPKPNVHWVFNSRNIDTYGDHRHIVSRGTDWVNLTILDTREADDGTYTCVANGSGLMEERHLSLVIQGAGVFGGPVSEINNTFWLIVGLVIGVVVLLVLVIVLFCCFCRRPRARDKKGMQGEAGHGANGDVTLDPDQSKSLLVNPVQKPPRRAEMQPLVAHAANTQITAGGKSPFVDHGSVFMSGSSEDNRLDHSTDSMDSQRDDIEPPDLLSGFPSRGSQSSPAGSTASTAPDSHRLPSQRGLPSPVHHYAQSLCGTLPYSRSHSPFTPVQSRQGYVTIPRRPRVPSWASMPSPSPVCLPGDPLTVFKLEPVYDNLGPRTTADGSSVLSLTKAVDATPMRGRPLPPTPIHNTGLPAHYAPIEETALRDSPLLSRASNRSTPNISVAKSPSPNYNQPDTEDALLQRLDDEKKKSGTSSPVVNGHTPASRNSIKVPPKPPPKPKKKKNSDTVSPLFEDEGEDGTEV